MEEYGLLSLENSNHFISANDYSIINSLSNELDNYATEHTKKSMLKVRDNFENYTKINDVQLSQPDLIDTDTHYHRLINKNKNSIVKTDDPYNPIDVLVGQEPDFMPNMYNVYILLLDNDKSAFDAWEGEPIAYSYAFLNISGREWLGSDKVKNYSVIGMRADKFEVPQKQQESIDIKMCGQHIAKISGKVNKVNKSSIDVALDQSMFILDAMHRLNGDFFAQEREAQSTFEAAQILEGKQFYINFGKLPIHYKNSKIQMIDIIVEYDADYMQMSRFEDNTAIDTKMKIDKRYLDGKSNRVQRYIFHDCRFLGRSSNIQFDSESANPIKATFPFTYRSVLRKSATGYHK